MATKYEFVVEMVSRSLRAEVRLNDCTVFRNWEKARREHTVRLNPWCLLGPNRLEVFLGELELTEDDEEPIFEMCLYKPDTGELPAIPYMIASFLHTSNEIDIAAPSEPLRRAYLKPFRINEEYGPWCWVSSAPYQNDDRRDVFEVLDRFRNALVERDTGAVQAMLAIRRSEICHALRLDTGAVEMDEYRYFESYFEQEDWAMDPLDPDNLLVRAEADGRLVRVMGRDGELPLSGRGGGRPFAFDVTLSKVEQNWVVVR